MSSEVKLLEFVLAIFLINIIIKSYINAYT